MADLEVNSVAAEQATSTQPSLNEQQEAATDVNAAFDSILASYETGQSTAADNTNKDLSSNTIVEPSAPQDQQPAETQAVAPNGISTQDQAAEKDYQQLVDRLIQDKDNHIKLLYARLNELSEEYKTLKQGVPAQQTPIVKEDLPQEVKDLYEVYPEIATAVEKIVESRVRNSSEAIEQKLATVVQPVAQQVKQTQEQQFMQTLLAKHPDLPEIVQSGSLVTWVNTLDPISKHGAQYVIQQGNVDDILALVDRYKSVKNMSTSTTPATSSQASSAPLVNKVLNAMAVPSSKQEPNAYQQFEEPKYKSTDDAFKALAKEYEQMNRR